MSCLPRACLSSWGGATLTIPVELPVRVVLDIADVSIPIEAEVARTKKSHRVVSSVEPGGIGLSIHSAPEAYYQLLQRLDDGEA